MSSRLRKPILVNVAWSLASALVIGLVLGGALVRLNSRRARIADQELQIASKRTELDRSTSTPEEALQSLEAALLECRELTENESRRIAELSSVARAAGVSLLSLRSIEPEEDESEVTVARRHELNGQGTYRQLATFLDGLYAARGMASIDELVIDRDDTDPAQLLRASLAVTWHAPNPNAGESEETP